MPLDSLLSLVEKLRERIDVHGSKLRQSEALTRYALIDPLLRELGWNTADPDLVRPEHNVGDGSAADYALFSDDKPVMVVEAKKLGTALQGEVLKQGVRYSLMMKKTRYLSVTDGRRWEIYEIPSVMDVKRIARFDLKGQAAAEVCRNALALWELRELGHVGAWQAPGVGPTPNQTDSPESRIPNPDEHKWQPISGLNPKGGDTPPVEVQFPDNSAIPVESWKSLLTEVARWLINNNHLTSSDCPIRKTPRSKRYVVHTEPIHGTGHPFDRRSQVESLYVHRFGGARYSANASRTIIRHIGQDPAQFKVRFS